MAQPERAARMKITNTDLARSTFLTRGLFVSDHESTLELDVTHVQPGAAATADHRARVPATAAGMTFVRRRERPPGEDAADVRFGEELGRRRHARVDARESVHRLLVPVHRAEQLLHLGRRRLERRELAGELEHRQHVRVARRLVFAHRVVERRCPENDWSIASAHSSASRNASVMPWAVMKSLLYPASPTSAQPGPYGLRK